MKSLRRVAVAGEATADASGLVAAGNEALAAADQAGLLAEAGVADRARALAYDDPRLALPAPPPSVVDHRLGRGEAALAKRDGPGARRAFQKALACDPTRTAPLWGLSRAADLVGERMPGRLHARRYLEVRGPDQDPGTARAALFRSEAP